MNHWMKSALAALFLSAVLVGCSGQPAGSEQASDAAASVGKDTIIIGLDDNYPPIGFRDEKGELVGSDIDLAKEAAKRLKRKVIFKTIDWASKEAELASGKIDVIWNGLTITPEREKNILFTAPYEKAGQVIALRKDSPIEKLADLKGKVIAIQDGSTAEDTLRKDPKLAESFKEIKRYPDMATIYMDLKLGRLDGAILDEPLSRYYTAKDPENFRVLPDRLSEEYDAVGVAKGNTALQAELNRVLDEMYRDGTTKTIFEKWFGQDISIPIEVQASAASE